MSVMWVIMSRSVGPRGIRAAANAIQRSNNYFNNSWKLGQLTAPSQHLLTNNKGFLAMTMTPYSTASSTQRMTKTPSPSPGTLGKLPSLPVPCLNDTLAKYLRTVKPLLSPESYKKTIEVVSRFGTVPDQGPKLQALLENRANSMDNWMAEWWLNTAYLEYREPVVVFSSPGLVFPLQRFNSMDDQLSYAAKLVHGALLYKESVDSEAIPPDFMGKIPLDMGQYKRIFGTTRIPVRGRDQLVYHPNSSHFVVAYKNYYFKVNTLDPSKGGLKSPQVLFAELNKIVGGTTGLSGVPVGFLTAEHRDKWADAYERLKKDPETAKSLKEIEEALFILAIDRPNRALFLTSEECNSATPATCRGVDDFDVEISERLTIASLQMLHGNHTNSANRWFDKTINFIVGTDGENGLTYEHSPSEGPPVANMMDSILEYVDSFKLKGPVAFANDLVTQKMAETITLQPLPLNTDADHKVVEAIAEAKNHVDRLVQNVQMAPLSFRKYGSDFIKSLQLSPDSFIQMAIQAAFYRLHGEPAAHYESASVRMFREGRTECIRSCSTEAVDFSKALLNPGMSLQDKFKAMKNAVEAHKKYVAEAVRGQGVDRHLLGLKKIAVENGMKVPSLYEDEGFVKSTNFRLSTSQVSSKLEVEAFMCYGPLTEDGYGCCYNPNKASIVFGISAFASNAETDANKYKTALKETLLDMELVGLGGTNLRSKL